MFREFLAVSKALAEWQVDGKNRFVCQYCADELHMALQSDADWPHCCNRVMSLKQFATGTAPTKNERGYVPSEK
jgi:hypothetical protein